MISTRTLFGFILVALGALFLLEQTGRLDAGAVLGTWWPLIIVALGAGQLIEQRRLALGPLIVLGVGVLLLLGELEIVPGGVWRLVWPVLLIVAGLALVFRRAGRGLPPGRADEVVSASAFFGGNDVVSTTSRFRGAALTAAFGGVSLDLRQAQLAPEGATISIFAAFGGVEVLVPHGWRVQVGGLPLLGGLENKANAPASPDSPLLRVDATVLFGGAEVKYEK
jgi:predicted membrane protein